MIGLCAILPIMAGCAPALFRANPQLQEKVQSIKSVAIMPPGIKVYQLAVGGATQLMDEPTETAKQIVATAIEKELRRHSGFVVKPFPSPSGILDTSGNLAAAGIRAELEDTQALFEAVSASVLLHTYKHDPDQTFPEKLKNFDYSLGPDVQQFAKVANALLFISGVDHISTGGRAALMFLGALIVSPGFLSPYIIGFPTFVASLAGRTIFSVALVDATTGALLWYNVGGGGGIYSLTDPDSATHLVEEVFEGFPVGTRPTRKEDDRRGWPSTPGPR